MAVKIFFSYAHKDERLLNKLKTHLKQLQREGLIDVWYDRDITAGREWEHEIDKHLNEAQIILLLVSPDYMDSDYCYSFEMKRALERHEKGEASVIPIILRPVYWQGAPFGKLQSLPKDAKPIKSWYDQDGAFLQVTLGILKAIDEIVRRRESLHIQSEITSEVKPPNSITASLSSETSSVAIKATDQLLVRDNKFQRMANIIREIWDKEAAEPLKVAFMGQTGVGKSTLLNYLFGTSLNTDPIRPATRNIREILVRGKSNRAILFYDLPGIGQNLVTDQDYLEQYRRILLESDIAIWGIHSDSRSFAFDYDVLTTLLDGVDINQQIKVMSKLIFVFTKADLLASSIPSPWILYKLGNDGIFVPTKPIEMLIKQKETYFREVFIKPFKHLIRGQAYCIGKFDVNHPRLSSIRINNDDHLVFYNGFLEEKELENLKSSFPKYAEIFDKLYFNYSIFTCSSLFKYNLDNIMNVIVQKLEARSIAQFSSHFLSKDGLGRIQISEAKKYRNIILVDQAKNIKIDYDDVNF